MDNHFLDILEKYVLKISCVQVRVINLNRLFRGFLFVTTIKKDNSYLSTIAYRQFGLDLYPRVILINRLLTLSHDVQQYMNIQGSGLCLSE